MTELEWLREHLIAPGLVPARRLDAWLIGWTPERPLLRHLIERGVLDASAAGMLSAAIKGYLRIESAALVGLFRGGDEVAAEDKSVAGPGARTGERAVGTGDETAMAGTTSETSTGSQATLRSERARLGARWTGAHAPEEAHSPRVRAAVDAALSGVRSPVEPERGGGDGAGHAIAAGLERVLGAVKVWSGGLGLRVAALPAGLERLTGELRGMPVTMTTQREQGGPFAGLTCATIRDVNGLLCSVTVIGLPAAGTPGPVLGVDLIGLGGALSLIAIDLAPVDRRIWDERAAAPLAGLHAALGDGAVARRWPEFATEVFSPRAVIAGARRGAEAGLLAAVAGFVACLPGVYASTRALPHARRVAADERVRAWRHAELRNRREHDALARIFGSGPAEAYLMALFGDPEPAPSHPSPSPAP